MGDESTFGSPQRSFTPPLITTLDVDALITLFEQTIEWKITPRLPEEERWRRGGGLCIMRQAKGRHGGYELLKHTGVGTTRTAKAPMYIGLALEKAMRLYLNPEHDTSWQSRNVEAELYGGAIRCVTALEGSLILSFSGFPEHWDEALCLYVATRSTYLLPQDALRIASNDTRPYYENLIAA